MTRIENNKLLKRIEELETLTERLEQKIQDIRISCGCVRRKVETFDDDWPEEPEDLCGGEYTFNCEPSCESCGQLDCICEKEEEEDHE